MAALNAQISVRALFKWTRAEKLEKKPVWIVDQALDHLISCTCMVGFASNIAFTVQQNHLQLFYEHDGAQLNATWNETERYSQGPTPIFHLLTKTTRNIIRQAVCKGKVQIATKYWIRKWARMEVAQGQETGRCSLFYIWHKSLRLIKMDSMAFSIGDSWRL